MSEERISYLEKLRCLAAFAVLFLHVVCTPFVMCSGSYSNTEAFLVRFSRNLMNWGVPVFVMITGSLLVCPEKELSIRKIFFKYIRRFVLAIVFFGTIFSLMELVFSEKCFNLSVLVRAVLNTARGNSWDHMWYLYMAAGLYALLPLFRGFAKGIESMEKSRGRKILIYVLAEMFFVSSAVPYISFFTGLKSFLPEISIYFFFLLLGYAVEKWNFLLSPKSSALFLAGYVLYAGLVQLNQIFLIEDNAALKTMENNSPVVVFAAFSIFSLFRHFCNKGESRIVKFLSPLTFGIYIIHPVAVNFCYKVLRLTPEKLPFFASVFSTLAAAIIFSIAGSWILRKILFVKKYLL